MNTTEDRLRDALAGTGEMIPPGMVPSLNLPARSPARRWLIPGVVAGGVALVAAGAVALQGHPAHRSAPPAAALPPRAEAPPAFYLAAAVPDPICVYDTATGKLLASTHIGGVTKVTATGDGRTYFALSDSNGLGPAISRIRITALGRVATVTRLPIRLAANESVEGLTASRDGTRLALAVQHSSPTPNPGTVNSDVVVADLTTGKTTTWSSTKIGMIPSLSMTADGRTLLFQRQAMTPSGSDLQVRALDLTAPGRDLMASRVVVASTRDSMVAGPVAVSPDGRHVAVVVTGSGPPKPAVVEYAVGSGQRLTVLATGVLGTTGYEALTFDPSGINLLVWGAGRHLGRVANGRFTPLPGPGATDIEATATW